MHLDKTPFDRTALASAALAALAATLPGWAFAQTQGTNGPPDLPAITVTGMMGTALALVAARLHTLARALNALALGEAAAGHVGIDVARLRLHVIVAVALLSALAVAWCGVIGFIGLMAPHLVRIIVGPDQQRVLPLAMGSGALLLLVADTVARTVVIPAEIPVGIFTALIGAPVFLAMLRGAARERGAAA